MIDPKELRINNAVSFVRDSQWRLQYVKEIGEFGAALHDEKRLFMYSDLFPVPLSPALLDACGFEVDGFKAWNISISPWPKTHLKQLSFAGDYLYLREGDLEKNRIHDSLCVLWNNDLHGKMFLHQLQNLFFALTGTELTVNLQKEKV